MPILLITFGVLINCGKNEQKEEIALSNGEELSQDISHPPYLRIPMEGVITTIDPGLTMETGSIELVEQLFLGLTDFDHQNYQVIPELAVSWEVDQSGRKYVFHLRDGVTWTNGDPVTAHDVVWAIQRNLKPETECPYAYMLYILKNAQVFNSGELKDMSQVGVKALDDLTVEFNLEHAAAYFPAMAGLWTYRPLPGKTVQQYGKEWTDPNRIQTNGSYMLDGWNRGTSMTLKKNPDYYDVNKVSIPEIRYLIIPESSIGLIMYENNELDIMGGGYLRLPLPEIPRIKANPLLSREYSIEPQFCTYYYGFNNLKVPVDNVLVRQAISSAVDRQLLIDIVTKGDQEPATTFTRPPIFGAVDPHEGVGMPFNPREAKALLAKAGYPDGKGFPKLLFVYNTSETHSEIAQAFQTLVKHFLNIDIELQNLEWDEYIDTISKPEAPDAPHLFRMGWCADYPDANNWLNEVFHPDNAGNRIGWRNKEFVKLMEQAQQNSDPEQRKALYMRAEQILCQEEAAIIPLYFYTAQYLVKPWVKGKYHMALGGQHIRNWYFE